jgi:predicted TIM-barrel fold metal-dependent hydrolase
MMFGSDYPFFPVDTELAFVRGVLSEADRDAVLGGNAARLLRLS